MGGQAAPKETGSIAEAAEAEAVAAAAAAAAEQQPDRQPDRLRVSEATKDVIRARLLCLSEAESNAELIQKVAEAPIVGSKAEVTTDGGVDKNHGSDYYRPKLMAMSDALPEVEASLCK